MGQEKEKYSSIFDAASRGKKAKPAVEAIVEKSQDRPQLSPEELQERVARCQELHNMIKDKIDSILDKRNISLKAMQKYFDTPQHFTAAQWRLIQQQKEELERELAKLVKVQQATEKAPKEKSKETKPKSMQTKSHWIPMR